MKNRKSVSFLVKAVFITWSVIFSIPVYAQISGVIMDSESQETIPNCVIQYEGKMIKSDENGKFSIYPDHSNSKVSFSYLGMNNKETTAEDIQNNPKVFLSQKYHELSEIEISNIDAYKIIAKFSENVSDNYYASYEYLQYELSCMLYNNSEIAFQVEVPIYLQEKDMDKRFVYDDLKLKEDTFITKVNKRQGEMIIKHFSVNYNQGFSLEAYTSFEKIRKDLKEPIVSTYTANEKDFYDIIFISKKPQRINMNILAHLSSQTRRFRNKKVITVFNLKIRKSNFALESAHTLSLLLDKNKTNIVNSFVDRNELATYLFELKNAEEDFYEFSVKFEQNKALNYKYILQNRTLIDNLFKIYTEPNYLLKQEINFRDFANKNEQHYEKIDLSEVIKNQYFSK